MANVNEDEIKVDNLEDVQETEASQSSDAEVKEEAQTESEANESGSKDKKEKKKDKKEKKFFSKDEPEIDYKKLYEEQLELADKYKDSWMRSVAEFDNYKRRTSKEKELIYSDTKAEVLTKLLPVLDNLERALQAVNDDSSTCGIKEGIEMVNKQVFDIMASLGVEAIEAIGQEFNPELHNAVMHIEDEKCDDNIIVEEFLKGYKLKEKVLRHSMVKVAN